MLPERAIAPTTFAPFVSGEFPERAGTHTSSPSALRRLGMGVINDAQRIDRYASWLIGRKAKELISTGFFPESDAEDIEQELSMSVRRGIAHYDPIRSGLKTFINRIVRNRAAGLIETRKAAKRGYGIATRSFDEEIEGEDGDLTTLHEFVDENMCLKRAGWSAGISEQQRDVKIDLTRAIRSLPPDLREVWERLKVQTVSEISQAMRVSRGSVYRKIELIRKFLEGRGLHEYL